MKKTLMALFGVAIFAAQCTENSTLLSDAATNLQGSGTTGSATATTSGGKLWVVGGTSGALSAGAEHRTLLFAHHKHLDF
jgi:photosystem II stability/assembly factor-like uncharacterized protein